MIVRALVISLFALLAPTLPVQAAADFATVIERVKPSVVAIGTTLATRQPQSKLLGTGFIVGTGQYVLTNSHVIPPQYNLAEGEELTVFVQEGTGIAARSAVLAATAPQHDLALLKISGAPLQALKLGDSDRVREGQEMLFTGYPILSVLGLYPATHRSLIAALTPIAVPADNAQQLTAKNIKRLVTPYNVFQLDGTAYPGNSGSPLYDPHTGTVIGIINAVFVKESKETILAKPSGIAYAIPINFAWDLLRSVKMEATPAAP